MEMKLKLPDKPIYYKGLLVLDEKRLRVCFDGANKSLQNFVGRNRRQEGKFYFKLSRENMADVWFVEENDIEKFVSHCLTIVYTREGLVGFAAYNRRHSLQTWQIITEYFDKYSQTIETDEETPVEEIPAQDLTALVTLQDNQALTTSLLVAEVFEKPHNDVLKSIRKLAEEIRGLGKMSQPPVFLEATYIHEQNKQEYPMYYMNRDGFILLAMGFTGERALKWKLKYIDAFNRMEEMLKVPARDPVLKPKDALQEIVETRDALGLVFGETLQSDMAIVEACRMFDDANGTDYHARLKKLLPGTPIEESGLYTPTMLGAELGLTAQKINKLLEDLHLQKKVKDDWTPTPEGVQYCETMSWSKNGQSGRQIKWKPQVLEKLQEVQLLKATSKVPF